jgi:hypothetical protein
VTNSFYGKNFQKVRPFYKTEKTIFIIRTDQLFGIAFFIRLLLFSGLLPAAMGPDELLAVPVQHDDGHRRIDVAARLQA